MNVHDWTQVDAGIFHDFHVSWITHLKESLKKMLPSGYYAMAEQHLGRKQGDVLALHASDSLEVFPAPEPPEGGTIAVLEAPPKVDRTRATSALKKGPRRTLTIRHISGHRIIALVEILSPGNKNTSESVKELAEKATAAMRSSIHLVVVDLFPPGKHDPQGMHAKIWELLDDEEYLLPSYKPLTLASYAAGSETTYYVKHLAVGDEIQDMPLFLTAEKYVNLPLATTYAATFEAMPDFWINVLEGRNSPPATVS